MYAEFGAIQARFSDFSIGRFGNLTAEIVLRGTTLTAGKLYIGINISDSVVLRGWGTLQGSSLRNSGKIIADGEGHPRDLDLRCYLGLAVENNNFASSNGWYAVNKGRLLFPTNEVTAWGATSHMNIGDRDHSNYPTTDLANSFRLSMVNRSAGVLYPSLLAPDHPAVPSGLSGEVLVVWHCDTPSFNQVTAAFRYDEQQVSDGDLIHLVRYDPADSRWKRIESVRDSMNFRLTTETLPPLGDDNFGWFALMRAPEPTLMIIH